MKYRRFEDLPAWKSAARFYTDIERLVDGDLFRPSGDLRNQLLRASLSISNNIAEGFELGTTEQLLSFIYIARGSAGECRSMLQLSRGSDRSAGLGARLAELVADAESISRQLSGWADSLKNSDIRGQRHLNDVTREHYWQRRRAEAFMQQIRAATAEAAAQREADRVAELEHAQGEERL